MSPLFAHQESGAQYLAERAHGYLADQPGLGKTRTLIRALQLVGARRPLIICPAIARTHWRHEAIEMVEERTPDYVAFPRVRSYDEIVRGGETLRAALLPDHDALILDEVHMLRTPSAQRTKLILGKGGYARLIPRVWAASGTPMWKTPDNLWTILSTLWPHVVAAHGCMTAKQWLEKFCKYRMVNIGGGRYVPKIYAINNPAELTDLLRSTMLRRTLEDVGLDVPEIFWQPWEIDATISEELREAETEVCDLEYLAARYEVFLPRETAATATMRRLVGEAKAPAIAAQIADQLDGSNEKLVVFAHHRRVLGEIALRLQRFGVAYVDGDTSQAARDEAIRAFQTGNARVFVGQTIACHTAITLTAANRVILVEPDWTANVNYQAAKRVARIGQTAGHCIAQMVSLAGTLDTAIVRQNLREVSMEREVFANTNGGAVR